MATERRLGMIFIAHRGNIYSRNPEKENSPDYLEEALKEGYDVECDVRAMQGKLYLGHDRPTYQIEVEFLQQQGIWTHCKNVESLSMLCQYPMVNCFFHDKDPFVLTNKGYIWCYPQFIAEKGIIVHPEVLHISHLSRMWEIASGICSDEISKWRYN